MKSLNTTFDNNSITCRTRSYIGVIGAAICLILFLCTAMIYACIKFLQEWATPLTLARARGYTAMAEMILRAGGR